MFSHRLPPLVPNRWWQVRLACRPQVDLTVSNPTKVGIAYPEDLLAPLAHPRGLRYEPEPAGLWAAREAVAAWYQGQGLAVSPQQVLLTASTSESYGLLAKLLCNPGEGLLVPQPSYPLFEHLFAAEGVMALPYPLPAETQFHLEVEQIPQPRQAQGLVVVQPNNPTGGVVPERAWQPLVRLCARQGWALIADEVFWPFPLADVWRTSFANNRECLTFVLGGLSKLAGLPQLKLGWIVVSGPEPLVHEAWSRLEFLADTYLSVATPTQQALGEILQRAEGVGEQIRQRLVANWELVRGWVAHHPWLEVIPPEGGWSAVLRYPAVVGEEELVVWLLQHHGLAVYPGFFFDFPREGYLVVSLLICPDELRRGLAVLGEALAQRV
ncbi:MAG: pyridoxal phosphate-dependent aminotransferase [Thermoanaerobaculum sp.]|nr:pyridoxal phosphate-dependent aminotransferase [Thermoanaerobaculum sp.]